MFGNFEKLNVQKVFAYAKKTKQNKTFFFQNAIT